MSDVREIDKLSRICTALLKFFSLRLAIRKTMASLLEAIVFSADTKVSLKGWTADVLVAPVSESNPRNSASLIHSSLSSWHAGLGVGEMAMCETELATREGGRVIA